MTDTTTDQTPGEAESTDRLPKPLHRRIADQWNSVNTAGKLALLGGAVVATIRVLAALEDARNPPAEPDSDPGRYDHLGTHVQWNNHGLYYMCRHHACSKKVDWTITRHDCCGRCTPGRNCLKEAQRDYAGPGNFAHRFWDTLMHPDACATCGEQPEAHPER
ncbi:hypothetical protein [Streptomyces sp. McG3]|uniref:hypothetical protein n=1 Tax=Streptomyces sp. McG3 TaxID=2725483 RepID=UPI001BE6AC3D|nr:hypothetical protein [Streptomyces sp. McG3]MBT2896411.1 hypothetical protein [Streptomyces sp. McG3]